MKELLLIFITITILISCTGSVNENASIEVPRSTLTIVVYDISKSTDAYAILTSYHIESLYNSIGKTGGGMFYGLHIQTNSIKQDPITLVVPALQQITIKGNAYQQANRNQKNKKLASEFESIKDSIVAIVNNKLIVPKIHNFSDVGNALMLARKIMENPMYSNYVKNLVIISDMENDLPPRDGIDSMHPIEFGSDVSVLLVRPSDRVNINELISEVKHTIFVSIDDAFNSLFTN